MSDIYGKFIRVVLVPEPDYEWLWNKYGFLDNVSDGYCVINPGNLEEYISDKICNSLKLSRAELGRHIVELQRYVVKEDFERFADLGTMLINKEINHFVTSKRLIDKFGNVHSYLIKSSWDGPYIITVYTKHD